MSEATRDDSVTGPAAEPAVWEVEAFPGRPPVAVDLPKPYGETGPQAAEGDPYERAAREIDA